jgi:hypothetical protein
MLPSSATSFPSCIQSEVDDRVRHHWRDSMSFSGYQKGPGVEVGKEHTSPTHARDMPALRLLHQNQQQVTVVIHLAYIQLPG